jgi:TonB family protein
VYYSLKPGSGISPPHATYSPDPEYSPDARELKYQGTVLISLIADASGTARDLQLQKPLGLGLDEKAVAAVSTWKFEPAQKDGKPVSIQLVIQINFHL